MAEKGGQLCWDYDALFDHILLGMERCAAMGKAPVSAGIDTWGVDFVLLDRDGRVLGNTAAYRDGRTDGMAQEVFGRMPEEELYRRTGIQTQPFNTIFQLMAVSGQLDKAETMLLAPNYLSRLLSGVKKAEYTIATTTGLVNAVNGDWDEEILRACGFPRSIFPEIVPPGTVLGGLLPGIRERVGFDCKVVLPCCHDTGSAVMAVPSPGKETLYISSGTWSLLGVERQSPDCSPGSMKGGFTNEGGYGGRYRFLKNIMGLWMIQSVRKEFSREYSYGELAALAEEASIDSLIDCNDNRFLAPGSMAREIQAACSESGQKVPSSPGELAAVIYHSLADCYGRSVKALEELTGVTYPAIYIVGGGSADTLLNNLTERYTAKPVRAGPAEATAIGNLMAQMISGGAFAGLEEARRIEIWQKPS
jgi:rhamnulokinase